MKLCTEVIPKATEAAARIALSETLENEPWIEFPIPGNYPDMGRLAGVILTGKKWETGRAITLKFLMGVDAKVASRIRETAEKWLEFVNLDFHWASKATDETDVRIATNPNDGSWSYLGTDHLTIPRNEPTMNFGWLEPDSDQAEYDRVVLHEFGHMMGFPHEHQHPRSGIPWDRAAVVAYYASPPNRWDLETIEQNLFRRYDESVTRFSEFDRESIMLYPIPNELTIGDYQVGWNLELSEGDRKFAEWQYPRETETEVEVDPFDELKRVPVSTYHRGNGYNRECVVTHHKREVAYSIPFDQAERRAKA